MSEPNFTPLGDLFEQRLKLVANNLMPYAKIEDVRLAVWKVSGGDHWKARRILNEALVTKDVSQLDACLPRVVVRRRIVQSSLCLRFYRSAGWTREDVRQLLREDQRLARVFPRYFDERDKAGRGNFELDDGLPHDDCDYFAVYGVSDPFSREALALHEKNNERTSENQHKDKP